MNDKWDELKKIYKRPPIPRNLSVVVEESISKSENSNKLPKNRGWQFAAAIMAVSVSFVIAINTSSAFATQIEDIPILSDIAKVFTFKHVVKEDEKFRADMKFPELEGIKDKKLQAKINNEIDFRMQQVLKEATLRAEEYRKANLETGGNPKDLPTLKLVVDYKIHHVSDQLLSFSIYSYETVAKAYNEKYYYNIDLTKNRVFTLSDLFKPNSNYKESINEEINKQINERQKDSEKVYFKPNEGGFVGIHDQQNFYLNDKGDIVITFQQYEIAPGYMGEQEFIVKRELLRGILKD